MWGDVTPAERLRSVTRRHVDDDRLAAAGLATRDPHLPAAMVAKDVAAGPALLMVRPELIAPLRAGELADFTLQAEIAEIFSKGGTVQYRATLAGGTPLVFELPGASQQPARLGEKLTLGFPKRDIYLFRGGAA